MAHGQLLAECCRLCCIGNHEKRTTQATVVSKPSFSA